MIKLTLSLILLFVHFLSLELNAQTAEIDSLENQLQQYTKKDTIRVNLLNETAFKLYSIDLDKTLKYAEEAVELADKIDFAKGKAAGLRIIGIFYTIKGVYARALDYFHLSLEISEEIGDKLNVAKALNNIGILHKNQKNYSEAYNYSQRSLTISRELGYKRGIPSSLINLGVLSKLQGNYPKAIDYYQKALLVYKEYGDKLGVSLYFSHMGEILFLQGNYQQSLDYYQKAVEICEEIKYKSVLSFLYKEIGANYQKMNNLTKALNYSKKSLKIAKEHELIDNETEVYKQLSEIYVSTKNFKKAYENYVLYKELNDSIFNEDNVKKITGLEYQYQYDKEKQETELIQQKIDAVRAEEEKRQKMIRNSFIFGFVLMALLVFVVLRSYLQKHKANRILAFQKREIEEKNSELHEQNEEIQQLNEELSSTNEQLYFQREELETTLNKLKGTQSQLVQSEKMASVGILTAGIAHEINNPLNFIMGGKLAIENYINDNIKDHSSGLTPLLTIIDEGINRASNIVESLNRFSRTNKSNTEICDINSIIDNCLLMLNNQTKKNIEISKSFTNIPSKLIGNEGRLHQAILNIMTNAIQAINKKGNISISTNLEKEKLIIKIADTGAGISEENIKKITDPFFTTKDPGKGTGLGLSIAYNIIKEHKGSIKFESTEGEGTTVTITFSTT